MEKLRHPKNRWKADYQPKWTPDFEREYMKVYRANNKEKLKAQLRDWKRANPSFAKRNNKCERDRLKHEVLQHYGPNGLVQCSYCGFNNMDALCLDHINNDGAAHREDLFGRASGRAKGGNTFYRWLRKNNYPQDVALQVLCANCNQIKQLQWVRSK